MNFFTSIAIALCVGCIQSLKAAGQFDIVELNENEIVESYSGYRLITNHDIKLPVEQFAVRGDLGWISPAESKRLKLSEGKTSIPTPLGSKEFRLVLLTDSTKTPPEKMKARFVVFQDGRPKCQFEFNGFKSLDADWIDEKALRIVYWPGTRVRVIELINVETGKIIYKSASGIYDHLESPSARSKKPRRNKKLFQHFIFRATPHNPEWHNYSRSKSDLYGRVI